LPTLAGLPARRLLDAPVVSGRHFGRTKDARGTNSSPLCYSLAATPPQEATMELETRNPFSSANLMGHPLHLILTTLPIGLFFAVFPFDLIFRQTGNPAFATGARWQLGAGLIGAALAAIAGLIDFHGDKRIRDLSDAWQHAIGNGIPDAGPAVEFLPALSQWRAPRP
jgi:Predicted membrane protein (DUF2231)